MKASPSILEIVAKGYMMGWLKPPTQHPDPDREYKLYSNRVNDHNEQVRKQKTEPKPVD